MAESFVCQMYGKNRYSSVDEARLDMFMKNYQPKENENIISSVKKMDGSSLPPCRRVVLQKLKRTNFICSIWLSAFSPHPPGFDPENCGWLMQDGAYKIQWFEGHISPMSVEDICLEDDEAENEGADDTDGYDEGNREDSESEDEDPYYDSE